ncbi:MAG TPA: efflux RND transporter periplasmic adaptor subunit [Cyclobacteriaceae bacterium]|nr:efflux RND transporter periplasmic adaptor subunit [Cyclobacteriaceae bacterium]
MKNSKQIIILIIGCLFFGGVIGWSLRPGSEDEAEVAHSHSEDTAYTCSMHPQIRQAEPGSCPICGMALVPVQAVDSGANSPYKLKMSPSAVALANIATTEVAEGHLSPQFTLTGKIQPDETRRSIIAANVSGRIDKLYVTFTGQAVKKGDKLASVYAPELVSAQRELLEAVKIKTENPALYQAARNKLSQWKLTSSQIDQLETSAELQQSVDVFADVSGVVATKNVSEGDFIAKGSVMFEMVDLQRVWVLLDAYESELSHINVGDKVTLTANAYQGQPFDGRVIFIDPILDAQSRTVKVRVEADNPSSVLKPEMFVTAILEAGNNNTGTSLVIPKSAVLWTGAKSVAYVQVGSQDEPAFEMREVSLGASFGDRVAVNSGLQLGEKVVSSGAFAVDGAAQLSGNYSMMNRPQVLDVSAEVRSGLERILKIYFELKNHLVDSDAQKAALSARSLHKAIEGIDLEKLDSNDRKVWEGVDKSLMQQAHHIAQASDLDQQRAAFQSLSDRLILLVEKVGSEQLVYKQYCPMADQDKGAYWLSEDKAVRNPYFGESMLKCGEVKETYQKKS